MGGQCCRLQMSWVLLTAHANSYMLPQNWVIPQHMWVLSLFLAMCVSVQDCPQGYVCLTCAVYCRCWVKIILLAPDTCGSFPWLKCVYGMYKEAVLSHRCLVGGLSEYDRIPCQLSAFSLVVDKWHCDSFFPLCTSISTVTDITTALMRAFICHWHRVILAVDGIVN